MSGKPAAWAWLAVAAAGCAAVPREAVLINLVAAPGLEEYLFREGLQRQLMKVLPGQLLPALLTALAFAGMHVLVRPDLLSLATLVPALLLGLVYARTQDLTLCAGLHAAMNLAWLAGLAPLLH